MTERVDQMLAALPRGNSLDDAAWIRRHVLLMWLLALHLPGLLLFATRTGHGDVTHAALELVPLAAALCAGLALRSRLVRSAAISVGLVFAASLVVHISGGLAEAHFHYFVVLGFGALYQDWRPYLAAIGAVVVGHVLAAVWFPHLLYGAAVPGANPWRWPLVLGAFVVAAGAAHVLFWKQTERQQRTAHEYYIQLFEGERAVVAQLKQAQMVKDELVGVVGHEFRTPLTAIQGFARTLDARFDRMDRDAVQTCTQAIEREAKKLTRMVANLLTASEEIKPSERDSAHLDEIATRVIHEVVETMPVAAHSVHTHVAAEHVVRVREAYAHQLLFNLVDNAVKFAAPDSEVRVETRKEGDMVVLEVANVGSPISATDRERIFDAFVQADSSDTRRHGGIGLGLHIARKIVTAYGGRIAAFCDGPVVIIRAWLPEATAYSQPRLKAVG